MHVRMDAFSAFILFWSASTLINTTTTTTCPFFNLCVYICVCVVVGGCVFMHVRHLTYIAAQVVSYEKKLSQCRLKYKKAEEAATASAERNQALLL